MSDKPTRVRKEPARLAPSKSAGSPRSPKSPAKSKTAAKPKSPAKSKAKSKATTGKSKTKTAAAGKSKTAASKSKAKSKSPTKQSRSPRSPSKPRATKGSSHSYPSMVSAAISGLHQRGGSSYQAIESYIKQHHPTKEYKRTYMMRALKRLQAESLVQREGHSYKLTDKAKRSTKRSASSKRSPRMSKRAAKSDKDPNAPKRSLSAYMFFAIEHRAAVKEKNPDATFGDLGKLIAADWAALPTLAKKTYETQAAKDKARYEREKAAYVPPAGSAAAKKAEKEAKPKRPPSPYNIFVKKHTPAIRAANPGITQQDVLRLVADQWKKHKAKAAAGTAAASSSSSSSSSSTKAKSPSKAAAAPKSAAKPAASKAPATHHTKK
jgi:HMG (high mobility group) box/linker histone H1 and H5 family